MKNFIIGFLALPLFVTAEPFVDYDYSEQVTEMTVITVKPNLIDDYLMGIKRTWVDSFEIQKELGHIVGCSVYTAETAGTDPNVFLTILKITENLHFELGLKKHSKTSVKHLKTENRSFFSKTLENSKTSVKTNRILTFLLLVKIHLEKFNFIFVARLRWEGCAP